MTAPKLWSMFAVAALICLRLSAQTAPATAIVGGTLIDGTGGAPIADAVVRPVGFADRLGRPAAQRPDPGWRDRGRCTRPVDRPWLHRHQRPPVALRRQNDRYETLVRYQPRQRDIVLEAAQIDLSYGVTTVRDSYGALMPLAEVRDAINRGEKIGARILAAGNIVGWGGPYSFSFSRVTRAADAVPGTDERSHRAGRRRGADGHDARRAATRDRTPTRQGTRLHQVRRHQPFRRADVHRLLCRSAAALVDEAHRRGRMAETHATSVEGLRLSIAAGIDGIQHPEVLDGARAARRSGRTRIVDAAIVCSMLVNTITGAAWTAPSQGRDEAAKKRERGGEGGPRAAAREDRPPSGARRLRTPAPGSRCGAQNAQKLIRAGALRDARHRQLLGGGAGADADAEARRSRITASARSWPSKGWSSWA